MAITMKFAAVGDMLVQRRLHGEYDGFHSTTSFIGLMFEEEDID